MFRSNAHARPVGRWVVTTAFLGIAGCGGGGEEAAAPDPAASAEAAKPGPPTVKGLGSQARERQGEMDAQASGGAAPAAAPGQPADPNAAQRQAMMQAQGGAAPAAAAQPADPNAAQRQAMMQAQAGGSGGRRGAIAETEGPPPTGPGADAASAASSGGYVPAYAQGGAPGGGAPPGVSFGAAPGPGGQAAAMMRPGGYGAPGTGIPGMGGGGGGGSVLLAETAFLENGEALTNDPSASQPGGAGQPGFEGPGGPGGTLAADDFSEPTKAVESFLSAVQAKNGERIGAAISRRAPGEAKAAGLKRVMTAAVDRKLTDEDVSSISEAFADYKVLNITPGRTSGSVNVTIGRERKGTSKNDRSTFERRIMRVHRDGNTGWKILDFGNRIVND